MIEGNELWIYGDRDVSELTTLRRGMCGAGDLGPESGRPENVVERGTLGQRLASRAEYEYEIPAGEAGEMLDNLCKRPLIEKTRYRIDHHGMVWEIDKFDGDNAGLIIAEVELENEDQTIVLPDWVGKEVTDDRRYYNANLIACPYKEWK